MTYERDLETRHLGGDKEPSLDHPNNNIVKFTESTTFAVFEGKTGHQLQGILMSWMGVMSESHENPFPKTFNDTYCSVKSVKRAPKRSPSTIIGRNSGLKAKTRRKQRMTLISSSLSSVARSVFPLKEFRKNDKPTNRWGFRSKKPVNSRGCFHVRNHQGK